MAVVLGELPNLPFLPELPARGPGADIIGRTAALLVDLPVETTADRMAAGRAARTRPGPRDRHARGRPGRARGGGRRLRGRLQDPVVRAVDARRVARRSPAASSRPCPTRARWPIWPRRWPRARPRMWPTSAAGCLGRRWSCSSTSRRCPACSLARCRRPAGCAGSRAVDAAAAADRMRDGAGGGAVRRRWCTAAPRTCRGA